MDGEELGSPISGERLRTIREMRGWSQGKLAQRSGMKQPLISMLESGEQRDTTVAKATALARALGVHVEELTEAGPLPDSEALLVSDPEVRLMLRTIAEMTPEDRKVLLAFVTPYAERSQELRRVGEQTKRRRREEREGKT